MLVLMQALQAQARCRRLQQAASAAQGRAAGHWQEIWARRPHLSIKVSFRLIPGLHQHNSVAMNDDEAVLGILKLSCIFVVAFKLSIERAGAIALTPYFDICLTGCASLHLVSILFVHRTIRVTLRQSEVSLPLVPRMPMCLVTSEL